MISSPPLQIMIVMSADDTVTASAAESHSNVDYRIAQLTSQRMKEAAAAVSFALRFGAD
jgi:hypothetical protein